MDVTREYREAFYADYVSGHQGVISESLSQSGLITDVMPHLPADRESSILDVGCGQGRLVALLHEHGYRNASGIDTSPEQVQLAEQWGRSTVRLGDLFQTAATTPAVYDVVIALSVIEHFERQAVEGVFRAFADLLKPGGRFIFECPNGSSPFCGRTLYGDLTHGVVYTDRSLQQVCHLTGFEWVRAFPVRPSGGTLKRRFRRIAWRALEAVIKLPLIIETGQVHGHIVTQNLMAVAQKPGGTA